MNNLSTAETAFVNQHRAMVGQSLNGKSAALKSTRDDAIQRFARNGFPARKSEAWKYTNIQSQLTEDLAAQMVVGSGAITSSMIEDALIPELSGVYAVIENGRFNADLSSLDGLPSGVIVTSLQDGAEQHAEIFEKHFDQYTGESDGLASLNTAFAAGGLFVYVPRGVVVEEVLQIISVTTSPDPAFLQPRMLVVVEDQASVTIIERTVSGTDAAVFSNRIIETFTGNAGRLTLIRVEDENGDATKVTGLYSVQRRDSYVFDLSLTLGGRLIRNNLTFTHLDSHCETHLNGFFVGRRSNHIDNHTLVDHALPDCFSNETYKGVLYDQSTGVFNGKVLVRQDAQRTNAYQSNKSIVISDDAQMYSKPELEIYADDVKCSHGATTGRLEPESIFYLQSRGLSEERARALLLGAFAKEVVESVENPVIRDYLTEELGRRVL